MTTLAVTSAGTKIYICATANTGSTPIPTTHDANATTGFPSLSYTEITQISTIGIAGDTSSMVSFMPVNDSQTYKFKSNVNSGVLTLKGAFAPSDPGQALLAAGAAGNSPNSYAFKLALSNGSFMYANGIIMNYTTDVGTVAQIMGMDSSVEMSGGWVRV